jgi:predicted ATPase with chaperone activity
MEDFNVIGLPDNAVKESRQRVKSALRNCGFDIALKSTLCREEQSQGRSFIN